MSTWDNFSDLSSSSSSGVIVIALIRVSASLSYSCVCVCVCVNVWFSNQHQDRLVGTHSFKVVSEGHITQFNLLRMLKFHR